MIDAKKATITAEVGLQMALASDKIIAAKGKKIVEFTLSGGCLVGATNEALSKAIIGPSGNLRAPTIWIEKTLYVGFLPEMYAMMLGT